MGWNVCRDLPRAGFTIPTYSVWENALGPRGADAMHSCLEARYARSQRRHSVFWRGGTSGARHCRRVGKPITPGNILEVDRVRLVDAAAPHVPMLDAAIVHVHEAQGDQEDEVMRAISHVGRVAHASNFEDYNHNAVVLDIDGNGWSDRFGQLMHWNTPILKQASNATAFFEHLVAPRSSIESYSNDLSDWVPHALSLLDELDQDEARLNNQVRHHQGLARLLLSQLAVTHAMAYTLSVYSNMTDWQVVDEPGYTVLPKSLCCTWATLPVDAVARIRIDGGDEYRL